MSGIELEKSAKELFKEVQIIERRIIFLSGFVNRKLNLILTLQILFKIISVYFFSGR